ncbi:hypothetical protein JXR93_02055 [bacterium]|nr:hypothetical protein [bacterium]
MIFITLIMQIYILSFDMSFDFDNLIKYSIHKKNWSNLNFLMEYKNLSPYYNLANNWTILQEVITIGDWNVIERLLEKIDNINTPLYENDCSNILDYLIEFENVIKPEIYSKTLKIILQKGGKPCQTLDKQLYSAVIDSDKKRVDDLVKKGGDITNSFLNSSEITVEKYSLFKKYLNKKRLLPILSNDKDLERYFFKEILNSENINLSTHIGTPLLISILKNNKNLFKYLLDNGANVNLEGYNFSFKEGVLKKIKPLTLSIAQNNVEFTKMLLDKGALIEDIDVEVSFISKKYKEFIELFIKNGKNFNFRFKTKITNIVFDFDSIITTPLILAIVIENFEIIDLILETAPLNYIDSTKKTALDYLIEKRNIGLIKKLENLGAKKGCEILKTDCK